MKPHQTHQAPSCYRTTIASTHTLWPHLHKSFPYFTSHLLNAGTACHYCVTVVVVVVVDVDVVVIVVVVLSTNVVVDVLLLLLLLLLSLLLLPDDCIVDVAVITVVTDTHCYTVTHCMHQQMSWVFFFFLMTAGAAKGHPS